MDSLSHACSDGRCKSCGCRVLGKRAFASEMDLGWTCVYMCLACGSTDKKAGLAKRLFGEAQSGGRAMQMAGHFIQHGRCGADLAAGEDGKTRSMQDVWL